MSGRPFVAPVDAASRVAAGAFLLDVRQPEEWAEIRIDAAVLIPLSELAEKLSEVPRDEPVIVVCRSGNRSGYATDVLRAAGVDAFNLDGGMNGWIASGLPTRTG